MARTQNHKNCDLPDVICKLLHSPVGKKTVTAVHMYLMWVVNFRVPTVQDHFRWMCLREPRRLGIMYCLLTLRYPFVGSDMSGTCGFCYLSHWASCFQLVHGGSGLQTTSPDGHMSSCHCNLLPSWVCWRNKIRWLLPPKVILLGTIEFFECLCCWALCSGLLC